MVDAHQDLLHRKFCGEGAPNFYAKDEWLSLECSGIFYPTYTTYLAYAPQWMILATEKIKMVTLLWRIATKGCSPHISQLLSYVILR